MRRTMKVVVIGTILTALLIPGWALATQPAGTYIVTLQNIPSGWVGVTFPNDGQNYYVPNGESPTFTYTTPIGDTTVPGMLVDDPSKTQGYLYVTNIVPNSLSQSYTVNYLASKPVRVINPEIRSTSYASLPAYGSGVTPGPGAIPTPMWGETYGFRIEDPLNAGGIFNKDGTSSSNPVISSGSATVGGVTYLLKRLENSANNFITFNGQQHVVYSAVPQEMTISQVYQNPAPYYDPASLMAGATKVIDFTIPSSINGGLPTGLAANQPPSAPADADKGATGEAVYLTTPPGDPDSRFFIPNLPNSGPTDHSGLTANIYFVIDPFIYKPGYWPSSGVWPGGTFHLVPYGWALDPRTVNNAYFIQLLDKTGGQTGFDPLTLFQSPATLANVWKHTILGSDPSSAIGNLLPSFFSAVSADPDYPFPGPTWHTGNYPAWFANAGCYFHVQPMPGFQRNLIRWYTAWGAYQLQNQTSDLFVRADGTVELPAVKGPGDVWRYAPIVTQTWDGNQRFTVLNTTGSPIPSTYDDYPGAEYYLPGNVYLPGKAGVANTYVNYQVWDLTGKLDPRETDLWMGLQGDTVQDVLYWADAPVDNVQTEPGGQANKPFMFGGYTNPNTDPGTKVAFPWQYKLRLQSSNSFCIARLTQAALRGKLYDASFYADLADGKGYQLIGTISYKWQPWTIDATGKWALSPDTYGAGVPQLTFANPNLSADLHIQISTLASFAGTTGGSRVIKWGNPSNIDPGAPLNTYANKLNAPLQEYFIYSATLNPNYKFLIVLTAPHDITGANYLLLQD